MSQNKNALIIDDSPSIREYLQVILKDELNFNDVKVACCADEGMDILISDQQHAINWIISDWEMPGKPASELFQYVNSNYRDSEMNTILITGKNSEHARQLADTVYADEFISKPFKPGALVNKLKRLMGLDERRVAKRVTPCVPVEVDIGFDNYGEYGSDLVNISESGCLLKMQCLNDQQAHVNDIATLKFTFRDDTNLDVHAQIVRVERDNHSPENEQQLHVAFEFKNLDGVAIARLRQYINQCQLVLDTNAALLN